MIIILVSCRLLRLFARSQSTLNPSNATSELGVGNYAINTYICKYVCLELDDNSCLCSSEDPMTAESHGMYAGCFSLHNLNLYMGLSPRKWPFAI